MVISAINALTLAPALCAIILTPHHGPKKGVLGWISRGHRRGARWLRLRSPGAIARRVGHRRRCCWSPAFALTGGAVQAGADRLPAGRGSGILHGRNPAARCRVGQPHRRGAGAGRQRCCASLPGVESVTTVTGYSMLDGLAKSNAAFALVSMEPFADRTTRETSVFNAIRTAMQQGAAIREAQVIAFNLPPIPGLGTGSGFEYQLIDLQGRSAADLAATARGLALAANQNPISVGVYTTFSAESPQLYLNIDRDRLYTLGVSLSDVFDALQSTLGIGLCQRLQPVRPRLAGADHRGARPTATRSTTSPASMSAPGPARWCRSAPSPRSIIPSARCRCSATTTSARPRSTATRRPAPRPGPRLPRWRRCPAQVLPPGFDYRMDRHRAGGKAGGGPDHGHPRPGAAVRLPVPRRALRKLDDPGPGAAVGGLRGGGCDGRAAAGGPALQHLCADRPCRADRAGRQERDPDRRIRQGAARSRDARSSMPPSKGRGPASAR